MPRRESAFARSWIPGAKFLAGGAFLTALGVYMLAAGLSGEGIALLVFGAAMAFGGPIMILTVLVSKRGGYGPCPVCRTSIEAGPGEDRELLCGGCGAYLDVDGDRLVTIETNRTYESPRFAAPTPWPDVDCVVSSTIAFSASDYAMDALSDLMKKDLGVRVMDARWPPGCCVCGRQVTRRDQLSLTVKMAGVARDKQATLVVRDVPYCSEHKDGVEFSTVSFASKVMTGGFMPSAFARTPIARPFVR
jgi:hypothetical protein